jgi:hypothetical protein
VRIFKTREEYALFLIRQCKLCKLKINGDKLAVAGERICKYASRSTVPGEERGSECMKRIGC